MQSVQAPIIPLVGELIRENPGTISLGQGVVHFAPPQEAIDGIDAFLRDPENHKYKPVQGIPALLDSIESKLRSENGFDLVGRSVVVTAGGNMAFQNALLAIADPGDEIILQLPYYFNHEMAIVMAGCRPVLVETDADYQLQVEAIRDAITPRTRAIVTVSPNNPTGAVYARAALEAVNQLCREQGIFHISDEAYEYFTYGGVEHYSPGASLEGAEYTISLYSLSKAYGFASWRIGYMVVPDRLLAAVKKIQDTVLICPPVISQFAAVGALRAGRPWFAEKLAPLAQVREVALQSVKRLTPLCTVPSADGAFYLLLKIDAPWDPMDLVRRLVAEWGVAVLPGGTFGVKNACTLRVGYGALRPEIAAEGISRLVNGLENLLENYR